MKNKINDIYENPYKFTYNNSFFNLVACIRIEITFLFSFTKEKGNVICFNFIENDTENHRIEV